jgi:hypothetical protein
MAYPTSEPEVKTAEDRREAPQRGVSGALNLRFARIADFCIRHAWLIIIATVLLGAGTADYVARHFAINTDTGNLLSPHLPWRKRDLAYQTAFQQQAESILAVVTAPTPEFASAAAKALTDRLSPQSTFFRSVEAASSGEFFARNGLLYLSQNDLAARMTKLSEAAPLIKTLVSDPSRHDAAAQHAGRYDRERSDRTGDNVFMAGVRERRACQTRRPYQSAAS